MVEIAHQRRARIAAGHLLRRAAHVDVDDVGAGVGRRRARPRPSSAPRGRRAGRRAARPRPARRAAAPPRSPGGQLVARRPFPRRRARRRSPRASCPERPVGHAGHRREEDAVRDGDRPDREWRRPSGYDVEFCIFIRQQSICPHLSQIARKTGKPQCCRIAAYVLQERRHCTRNGKGRTAHAGDRRPDRRRWPRRSCRRRSAEAIPAHWREYRPSAVARRLPVPSRDRPGRWSSIAPGRRVATPTVAPQHDARLLPPVTGGETRQESVRRGSRGACGAKSRSGADP